MKGRDYMCKVDLKDAYFTVPLGKSCCHLVRKGISMNSCVCALVTDQPLESLPKFWRPKYPCCVV